MIRIVLDTNLLHAGLYSADGASHQVLRAIEQNRIRIVVSPPLVFEYEDVLCKKQPESGLSARDIGTILDNLCAVSDHQAIYYLWRPFLSDPKNDHILEVAVASQTSRIITHNLKDFAGISKAFGIRAITLKDLLKEIR